MALLNYSDFLKKIFWNFCEKWCFWEFSKEFRTIRMARKSIQFLPIFICSYNHIKLPRCCSHFPPPRSLPAVQAPETVFWAFSIWRVFGVRVGCPGSLLRPCHGVVGVTFADKVDSTPRCSENIFNAFINIKKKKIRLLFRKKIFVYRCSPMFF